MLPPLSIYGSQAANGVILITTKQGKEGKPTVDVKSKRRCTTSYQLAGNAKLPTIWRSLVECDEKRRVTPQHDQYSNGATPVIPDYILPAGAMEGRVDLSTYNTAENQFMR